MSEKASQTTSTEPYTLNPKPMTLKLLDSTPTPQTLNPKSLETLTPKTLAPDPLSPKLINPCPSPNT